MRDQTPAILRNIMLEAESATNAWYQAKLLRLQEGFVVEKLSGRKSQLGDRRAWFFWDQSEAEKAVERIVHEKTSPGRKRVYRVRTIADETRNCDEGRELWNS